MDANKTEKNLDGNYTKMLPAVGKNLKATPHKTESYMATCLPSHKPSKLDE